jgi:hypothetical protein
MTPPDNQVVSEIVIAVVLAVVLLGAVGVLIKEFPAVRRYLRIRRM